MKNLLLSLSLIFGVSLSAEASISISPMWINFGNVSVQSGISQMQFVTVYNNSSKPVSLNVIPSGCFDFNVSGGCYGVTAYGSCSLEITFRPSHVGPSECSIDIQDLSFGGFGSVEVSGNGIK